MEKHVSGEEPPIVALFLQCGLLLPIALGQLTIESWAEMSPAIQVLAGVILLVVGSFIVRNLVRVWCAPAGAASGSTVFSFALLGIILVIMSTGPLLESDKWSTKPLGVITLLVGVVLLVFGVRDASRIRSARLASVR